MLIVLMIVNARNDIFYKMLDKLKYFSYICRNYINQRVIMRVLDKIEKQTRKSYRNLMKLYKKVVCENIDKFVGWFGKPLSPEERESLLRCKQSLNSETDDMYGTEKAIERYGHKVYLYNSWVSSNKIEDSALVRDGRYASPKVAFWYTPFHYMTNHSTEELYQKSETEKVLYESYLYDIKISITRKFVIPRFHSYQWCHKMSEPVFSLYVLSNELSEDDKREHARLIDELEALRKGNDDGKNNEKMREIGKELQRIANRNRRWKECICEKDMKSLFLKARRYFNDWYEYEEEFF